MHFVNAPKFPFMSLFLSHCRMAATIEKLAEGSYADIYKCMREDWTKLIIKVNYTYTIIGRPILINSESILKALSHSFICL